MKKLLYFIAAICLVASKGHAQDVEQNIPNAAASTADYVNLGLSSGTKWKNSNEFHEKDGFLDYYYDYDAAMAQFGKNLPTKEQWMELINECSWQWNGRGYIVTGPSGESIVLPAAGLSFGPSNVENVGTYGYYWSSTPYGSNCAWRMTFTKRKKNMFHPNRIVRHPIRLVCCN